MLENNGSLRERIVLAAVGPTVDHGWASITMAGVAAEVGVTRQSVYNEVGNKSAVAEEMVAMEFRGLLQACRDSV